MNLEISSKGLDLENFLPEMRKEKITEKSYIHIFPQIVTQQTRKMKKTVLRSKDLHNDTKKLADSVAKAIVKELTPQEEGATTLPKNIELTADDKAFLKDKSNKERHEYFIQKILLRSFEKTKNSELALRNGLSEIKEYCSRLVELSQIKLIKTRRKKQVSMEIEPIEPQKKRVIEKIEEEAQPKFIQTHKKRKKTEGEQIEKGASKRLLQESEYAKLLSSLNEIAANKKALNAFIEKRYPTLDIKTLDSEQINDKIQNYKALYSNIESLLPIFSLQQQTRTLEILKSEMSFEKIETEIFKLLREAVKANFTAKPPQDEPYRPLLPIIEKIFPRSPLLSSYCLLFDSLYEKYQNLDEFCDQEFKKIQNGSVTKQQFREFIQNQFSELCNSSFGPANLIKARQALGRLMFVIDHEPQNLSQYIQKPDLNFIGNKFPKEEHLSQIFENDLMDLASCEVHIIDHLTSALVRSDGAINSWLIQDLKAWLKSQIKREHISLTHHLNKVLNEIEYNENISKLLTDNTYNDRVGRLGKFLQDPASNIEGAQLVRAACNISPTSQINLAHVNKALISGLLSPWRQYYFGSCHTTGALIAIKSSATEAVVKDLQDVILTGSLTRNIQDRPTAFRASFSLYPVLLEDLKLEEFSGNNAKLCERLSEERSLQLAWELLQPTSQEPLKTFLKNFLKTYSGENSFTLQDIVKAMKPDLMSQQEFELTLKYLNSRYQNPLLQCWQNGVMGMHHLPLDLADSTTDITPLQLKWNLINTLDFFATKLKINNEPFLLSPKVSNVKFIARSFAQTKAKKTQLIEGGEQVDKRFQTLYDKSPTLKALRLIPTPPQTREQSQKKEGGDALINLALCDEQNRFTPITNEKEFFALIKKIFFEITHEDISTLNSRNEDKTIQQMMTNYSQTEKECEKELTIEMKKLKIEEEEEEEEEELDTDTPWCFDERISEMSMTKSTLYSTYFQASKEPEMIEIISDKNFEQGVCRFRDWAMALKQKKGIDSVKKLKIPSASPEHLFNAIVNDQMLTGPLPSDAWRKEREKHLISFLDKVKDHDLQPIVEKTINFLDEMGKEDEDFKEYLQSNKKAFALKKGESFWAWYARIGKKLQKDEAAEALVNIEAFIFQEMIPLNPSLKQESIFRCADSNWTLFDPISKKNCNAYYAFAFMPTHTKTPKWTTIKMYGSSMRSELLDELKIQKDPDLLIERFKTQSLLMPKGYLAAPIQRLQNDFVKLWKTQTSIDNEIDQRPKLKKIKARFQNAVNELRKDNKLAFSDELFITMYSSDTPDAIEALLEKDNEKINKLAVPA